MNTFDAQCAKCGKGESHHKPEILGENRKVDLVCPEPQAPPLPTGVEAGTRYCADDLQALIDKVTP